MAYDVLKAFDGKACVTEDAAQYGQEVSEALNSIINLNLTIEICGAWVWVSGDTKNHKDALKSSGFKWAPKKKMWYFRPSDAKKSRSFGKFSINEIRDKYGSVSVMGGQQKKLT